MSLFIAVVDSGSFTAAAAASGQTKSGSESFNIRRSSEERRNVTVRSARRLTLTDAGVLFAAKRREFTPMQRKFAG
ncbi:LysR family transcriptional regulator [Salmonella enterica subsp. enterica]|nr:LysR family transcriptional regulator [Salmonella enterica subsp. enterica]